jgi:hypothetical protein
MAGGGSGFVLDMIARIRENEESRKVALHKREQNMMQKILHKTSIKQEELSEEELAKIRLQVKKQRKTENQLVFLKLIITMAICIGICYAVYLISNLFV